MSDSLARAVRRESPLVELDTDAASGPVEMRERPHRALVNLRGDAEDAGFLAACQQTTGLALPTRPNTFVSDGERTLAWLGPDEWLLEDEGDGAEWVERLETSLSGMRHAVTDVSGGYTTIRLRGELALALLARGCSLDLHADAFGVGQCAQSHIAKAVVLLLKRDEAPCLDVIVRRSFADYLWRWLAYVNREILGAA